MKMRRILSLLVVILLTATACSSTAEVVLETTETTEDITSSEFVSGDPAALPLVDEQDVSVTNTTEGEPDPDTDTPETSTTETSAPEASAPEASTPETSTPGTSAAPVEDVNTCDAPTLSAHFVDVAADDADGGLNVRSAPNSQAAILATFERGKELISTGGCQVFGSADWWEVTTSDGALTGWASSRFLSVQPPFTPGIGAPSNDTADVGLFANDVDELVRSLSTSYGFTGNAVVTEVSAPEALDAIGGQATYDLTGLGDDSIDGYRLEIGFAFNKDANGDPISGVILQSVTSSPLCSRAVTPDGVCV